MKNAVHYLQLSKPSLKDNTADADRLILSLQKKIKASAVDIDFEVLKDISKILRANDYNIKCLIFRDRNRFILTGIAGIDDEIFAGAAIDIGTTNIVISLINLETKKQIAVKTFENPQIKLGSDILTRIHHAFKKEGLKELNSLVIESISNNINMLFSSVGLSKKNIYSIAIAGNTAMTHFFLGLDPKWLIREPYIPAINKPPVFKASEIGLNLNKSAYLFVFPNIGSYFGGDLISGLLYSQIHKKKELSILVDVGTNAEVVLGNSDWLMGCAGAAGPALEGGVAKIGMTAQSGAIDDIFIEPDTLNFKIHTIEEKAAKGICGSGFIKLAAQLFLRGILDIKGKLVPDKAKERIIKKDDIFHIIIAKKSESSSGKNLTISQIDIDNLIRSKAAMFTILKTILNTVGMDFSDLSHFFVAGTFGAFIDPESAVTIGMLPDIDRKKFKSIGNSSLKGAELFLTDLEAIKEVDKIRDRITYLELNVNQEFMNRFSAAKFLPHTDASLFPSVLIPS
jgi:uncharacterized 2Fe-2S/4Fe-4S cluster protein (DUF4445 family)